MEIQISIIIATYNAAKTLKNLLDSITPQLTEECELIIIDGKSQDDTIDVIQSYNRYIACFVSEPDKGLYDAWNKGVAVAKGKWIAFIGADDILISGAIGVYLDLIKNTSDINSYDYICAHNEHVDANGALLKVIGKEPKWNTMRKRMAPAHVASLHSRQNLFGVVGFFDYEHFRICADYELLLRKKDKLRYIMLPNHIARMQAGGMSFSMNAIKETYIIRKKHHSVSAFMNVFLFVRDVIGFKLFIIRKRLRGASFER